MSQNKISVSGPVNVIRLEGKVGNIEKSIYVFFDFHINTSEQTKCDDIRSEDVAKYMVDTFDEARKANPKQSYDFFFERGPLRPYLHDTRLKGIYLEQVSELFMKSFEIDLEKKKVQKSTKVPNVRFHHTDIRDYVLDIVFFWNLLSGHQLYEKFNIDNFKRAREDMLYVGNQMFHLQKMIYEGKENPKLKKMYFSKYQDIRRELSPEDYSDMVKNTIHKLRNSYENKGVKDKINKIIDNELAQIFDGTLNLINQCLNKLDSLIDAHEKFGGHNPMDILLRQDDGTYSYGFSFREREETVLNIVGDVTDIKNAVRKISVIVMDLYLLRRFLDKKYVTHALSYTGAHHSNDYVLFLVKYFDFKITHYSYLRDNNIKEAEEAIKTMNDATELSILLYPPLFLQCSDMTNFPPLFT